MIQVVGLGPGRPGLMSVDGWEALRKAHEIVLRTVHHEVAHSLKEQGIAFSTFDELYEAYASFEAVYDAIVEQLLLKARECPRLVYAVPGHPLVAEKTVELLLVRAKEQGIAIEIVPGMSSVEAVYAELAIDPARGMAVLDALDPSLVIDPRLALIITQVYNRLVVGDLKLKLLEIYPHDHQVVIVRHAGHADCQKWTVSLAELDRRDFSYADTIYVPPCVSARHASVELQRLQDIMVRLRGQEGCPWDAEQTHTTLKPYLIEEAYEVLEAIDEGDVDKLAEELGDLLLQVVFHATIAHERGDFALADSIKHINEKLIRRHPHVFSNTVVHSAAQVVENWQKIKQGERKSSVAEESVLSSVPKAMPALQQAFKVQERAKRVGFDWPSINGAWDKVQEELVELKEAREKGSTADIQNELGDVLFSMVNVSRFLGVEPEDALRLAIAKFRRRFHLVEVAAEERGIVLSACSLEDLDRLWDEIKLTEQ